MSTSQGIESVSAAELAQRIASRELSPVEVVHALRERAENEWAGLGAIVAWNERAADQARAAEAAVMRGDELGPLHGVPFTAKDTLDAEGLPATRGSRLFAGHMPERDSTAVARMRGAGGILLGKSNTPEFALWWQTDNLLFGRTANPWDASRTAGGSSGGEVAAIATGISPVGLGSDLGGSIRGPAAICGVVGLKATHGRVPLTGHFPEAILRFMHVGPLARTVRDAGLALGILSGPDGKDPYALPVPVPAMPTAAGLLTGVRVAHLVGDALGPLDPDVRAAVAGAAQALRDAGALVEDVEVPWLARHDTHALTIRLYGAEGRDFLHAAVAGRVDDLHPFLRERLGYPLPTLDEYLASEHAVDALRHGLIGLLHVHDLVLCAAAPVVAQPHGFESVVIDSQELPPRAVMRTTLPFDLTGSPALTVPWTMLDGLPMGAQLVGRHFDEPLVLRAGMALEDARGALPSPTP